MGSNIVWFDSLTKQRQYDLLFEWEQEKYTKRLITKPTKQRKRVLVKDGYRYKRVWSYVTVYPANLKHFIKEVKPRYRTKISRVREATIDLLLKNN